MTVSEPNGAGDMPLDLSQALHRRLIGWLGVLLPFLLYLVAGLRPDQSLLRWDLLPSVSAYYYTGAVGIFVGVLFTLSLFLATYQGYKSTTVDRIVGRIGGAGALGVALFPTAAPLGLSEPPWWNTGIRTLHYASAIVLFTAFALFSVWLFRKSSIAKREDRPPDKQWRDAVCLACGITIIVCMLWAGSSLITRAPIFWPEAIAIIAFAISWLVKGKAHEPLLRALRPFQREDATGAAGHD